MLAVWAETELVLADEFRDGNVPAMQSPLAVARTAFQALPATVQEYFYRGDSACHEHELLNWLRDERRVAGAQGQIGFFISARERPSLKKAGGEVPPAGGGKGGAPKGKTGKGVLGGGPFV